MGKVLVVVDMQNDFVDGALGTPEAQLIVPLVVEKIKNFSGEIYFTFDTHTEDYLNTAEGEKLPVKHCIKGSEGWQLNKAVAQALPIGVTMIEKPTFGSIALAEILTKKASGGEIDEIELVGLCTDICVVSNALLLKANMPEMTIKVDSSCCAGVSVESHEAALLTMKMCQIEVV